MTTAPQTTAPHAAFKTQPADPAWTERLLARRTYAVIGTENPDGSVHMTPLMYAFDGEVFLFESNTRTRKVRNLTARPRARVLVQGPTDEPESWVSAAGPTEIVTGQQAQELNATIVARYATEAGRRGWAATMGPLDDVTIVLHPERWWSWDIGATLQVMLDAGYTEAEVEGWFHPLDP